MLGEFSGLAARTAHRNAPGHYTGVFSKTSHQFDRAMRDAAFSRLSDTVTPIGPAPDSMKTMVTPIDVPRIKAYRSRKRFL
jgi:hypothetical protein